MPLYKIASDQLIEVTPTTFSQAELREREDLQRLLRAQIGILLPDAMVISEEFSDWDDSRRRIDLLAIDRNARLIVIELKRDSDGGHMELQALRYAAMISAMTFEQAVEAHAKYLSRTSRDADARASLLEFLLWDEPDEDAFGQDVRVVLAAADFGKELTTAVLWLNEQGLDITCIRMVPYAYGGETLLHLEQVVPLPEAEEYQVRVREKVSQERASRAGHGARERRNEEFWTALLAHANTVLPLHANVSPGRDNWLGASSGGVSYYYVTSRGEARVELVFSSGTKDENEAAFDRLHTHREEIERAFGGPLQWRRLEGKKSSRVAAPVRGGSALERETWPQLHAEMARTMKRLVDAASPVLGRS